MAFRHLRNDVEARVACPLCNTANGLVAYSGRQFNCNKCQAFFECPKCGNSRGFLCVAKLSPNNDFNDKVRLRCEINTTSGCIPPWFYCFKCNSKLCWDVLTGIKIAVRHHDLVELSTCGWCLKDWTFNEFNKSPYWYHCGYVKFPDWYASKAIKYSMSKGHLPLELYKEYDSMSKKKRRANPEKVQSSLPVNKIVSLEEYEEFCRWKKRDKKNWEQFERLEHLIDDFRVQASVLMESYREFRREYGQIGCDLDSDEGGALERSIADLDSLFSEVFFAYDSNLWSEPSDKEDWINNEDTALEDEEAYVAQKPSEKHNKNVNECYSDIDIEEFPQEHDFVATLAKNETVTKSSKKKDITQNTNTNDAIVKSDLRLSPKELLKLQRQGIEIDKSIDLFGLLPISSQDVPFITKNQLWPYYRDVPYSMDG